MAKALASIYAGGQADGGEAAQAAVVVVDAAGVEG